MLEERITRALDRIEARLLEAARRTWRSAVLATGDSSIILPCPGIGLLALSPGPSAALGAGLPLRSVQAVGSAGEVDVETLEDTWVQPFTLRACAWIAGAGELVHGLRLVLETNEANGSVSGRLSCWLETDETPGDVFARARATWNGRPVGCRGGTVPRRGLKGAVVNELHPVRAHVDALGDHRVSIDVPTAPVTGGEIVVELRFDEPVVATRPPRIVLNAVVVWNSAARVSPDPREVSLHVLGAGGRGIRPLHPRPAGGRWRAWHVEGVTDRGQDAGMAGPLTWHLAFVDPARLRGAFAGEPPVLAVVLDSASEVGGPEHGPVEVAYYATTGREADHVRVGDEFACDRDPDPMGRRELRGTIVRRLLGASDGLDIAGHGGDGEMPLEALLPRGRRRTVGEARWIFERVFGGVLDLVDEEDFVRPAIPRDGVRELVIRVRFRDRTSSPADRRAVLRAATVVLARDLRISAASGFRIVEESAEGVAS